MYYVFLIVSLFIGHALSALSLKRSVMMHVTEYEVNNHTFMHRIDTIDGTRKELWVVDGVQVPEHEYYDQFATHEALEHKKKQQEEYEKIRQQQDFIVQEQRAVLVKMLQQVLRVTEEYLNRLSDVRLEPYLTFHRDSFLTRELYDAFIHNEFLKAQELMRVDVDVSLKDVQDTLQALESYPERCKILYQHTLQTARECSDDTRLLKDLLHMVAESGTVPFFKH